MSDGNTHAKARRPGTLVLGVLGGIASGKSRVARLLAGQAGRVIDADRLAHEVLASEEVTAKVRERFGESALGRDGRPDRHALGRLVFDDPEARKALEGFTHPAVRAMIQRCLEDARREGLPLVVLDVPLLLEQEAEARLVGLCDALVFVESDAGERAQRARATRGWSPEELARREAAQLPLSQKMARADLVIQNRGSLEELEREVRAALQRLGAGRKPQ
jgi:dephospho-CoA kinase